MAYLEISKDDAAGVERFEIAAAPVSIGRAPTNHLILPDAAISRRHCVLDLQNGHMVIRDLGSANGLQVNGTAAQEFAVVNGDEIRMGPFTLVLHDLVPEASPGEYNGESISLDAPIQAAGNGGAVPEQDPQVAILEASLNEARASLAAQQEQAREEAASLQQRIELLERERTLANDQLRAAVDAAELQQQSIAQAERTRDDAIAQCEAVAGKRDSETAQHTKVAEERDRALQTVSILEAQVEQQQEQSARLDELTAELATARSSLQSSIEQLAERDAAIEKLERAANAAQAETPVEAMTTQRERELAGQIEALEESESTLRAQSEKLRNRIQAAEQRLRQRTEEIETLREELTRTRDLADNRAGSEIHRLQEEQKSLQAAAIAASDQVSALEVERNELQSQLNSAVCELEATRQRSAEHAAKVREWQQVAEVGQSDLNSAQAATQQLQVELASAHSTLEETRASRDHAIEQLTELQQRLDASEEAIAQTQAERESIEDRLSDLQSQVAAQELQRTALESERDQAQAISAGLEMTLTERSELLEAVELEREVLRQEVDRLNEYEPRLAEATARVTKLEAVLARGRAALHKAHDEAEFAQRECDNLVIQLHTVEQQRDNEVERANVLETQCTTLHETRAELERDLHRARVTAESLQKKLSEDESVLEAIRAAIGQTQGFQTPRTPAKPSTIGDDDESPPTVSPGDSSIIRAMKQATASTSNARDANVEVLAAIFEKGKRRSRLQWLRRWKSFIG